MQDATLRSSRFLPAALIIATTFMTGATIHAIGAPVSFSARAAPANPDAGALVKGALARIGGKAWTEITSYESIATVQSPMGDGRIEFRFVAPDARKLVQTMPGGKTALELGSVGGTAWMGEPGRARAVDPRMAEELAGGGDLLTLVRSIDSRFADFTLLGKEAVDGVECWKISMRPLQSPTPDVRWTLLLAASDMTIVGLEIPAPPKDAASNAPVQDGQSMRFRSWEPVERPAATAGTASSPVPLLAFREASVTTAGMKVDLSYSRVAVDTLAKGAIAAPAEIEPAPSRTSPARP
jgi:hypothetical protein